MLIKIDFFGNFIWSFGKSTWLNKILRNIAEYTNNNNPPVLWTGNGYHVIVVLNLQMPLEHIKEYVELGDVTSVATTNKISNEFIHFSKSLLSNNKADLRQENEVLYNLVAKNGSTKKR